MESRRTRRRRRPVRRAPSLRRGAIGAGLVIVLLTAGVAWLALNGGSDPAGTTTPSVGRPIASAAGVRVDNPSVDLGPQPLDTNVSHAFVLTNTNDRPVELGRPAIEVLDGC